MAQGKKCDKREKYKCGQTKKKTDKNGKVDKQNETNGMLYHKFSCRYR